MSVLTLIVAAWMVIAIVGAGMLSIFWKPASQPRPLSDPWDINKKYLAALQKHIEEGKQ